MTRANKGNYSAKHPEDARVAKELETAVSRKTVDGRIACSAAFTIAEALNTPPGEVGKAIDLQEGRIYACQLGLFGYGDRENRLQAESSIAEPVQDDIRKALVNGQLRCIDAWHIAAAHQRKRIEIAGACESMSIKICQCQLGAF